MTTKTTSRRKFSAEFKSKVAIEALQERSTLSEISKRYDVHPNMITQWKKALLEKSACLFQDAHPEKDKRDKLIESLFRLGGPQGRSGLVRKISPHRDWIPRPSSP
jgi:transposase